MSVEEAKTATEATTATVPTKQVKRSKLSLNSLEFDAETFTTPVIQYIVEPKEARVRHPRIKENGLPNLTKGGHLRYFHTLDMSKLRRYTVVVGQISKDGSQLRYGATVFRRTKPNESFSKAGLRQTALQRFKESSITVNISTELQNYNQKNEKRLNAKKTKIQNATDKPDEQYKEKKEDLIPAFRQIIRKVMIDNSVSEKKHQLLTKKKENVVTPTIKTNDLLSAGNLFTAKQYAELTYQLTGVHPTEEKVAELEASLASTTNDSDSDNEQEVNNAGVVVHPEDQTAETGLNAEANNNTSNSVVVCDA